MKIHGISDVENGTLSIEAWIILSIHILLRYQYVPNLHENCALFQLQMNQQSLSQTQSQIESARSRGESERNNNLSNTSNNPNPIGITNEPTETQKYEALCRQRLDDVSILYLLDIFFKYLTEEFDILGSIITLRGKGEVSN